MITFKRVGGSNPVRKTLVTTLIPILVSRNIMILINKLHAFIVFRCDPSNMVF